MRCSRFPRIARLLAGPCLWLVTAGCATPVPEPEPAAGSDFLAGVRAHLAAREYRVSESEAGLQAPNRRHDLRTYFAPEGIRVVGRSAPAAPLLSLRLTGWGRAEALAPAAAGELAHRGERVEIRRGPLVEWFVNGPEGLEHGFTLASRPPGSGPLILALAAEGARARLRGDAVELRSQTGRRLRYGALVAFDAAGARLSSRFEVPAPDRVHLVIADAGARYPLTIDPLLTEAADALLESDQGHAELGMSVASAGDVNGDGYGDVIVGSYYYDAGELNEGAAFVYLGGPSGIGDGHAAGAHTLIEGNQALAQLGESVASAGDVNGDGYADIIVGAHLYDAGESNEGVAFVFLGGAAGIPDGDPSSAHAWIESDQANAHLGQDVASAGDVNGDGFADIVVGAPKYDNGESFEGAAFVFLGSAAGIADGDPANAHARLEANQTNARMGISVASAGDVNADGYSDLIVGADRYDAGETNEGAAFVFLGSAAGIADGDPSTADARLEANQTGAEFGRVASAGDVNGDGYADVLAGARYYDAGEVDEGAAFVFLGGPTGIADADPSTAHARLESDQANAWMSWSVSSAGDVNGDGYSDVIVGAYRFDGAEADEGAAFVFLGSAEGIAGGGPADAHVRLESNQVFAQLGRSVACAGDVNGDGYDDVIAGARFFDSGQSDEGAAFLFLGGAAGIEDGDVTSAAARLSSPQPGARLGLSVASAGDIDGDGHADLIVGAPFYDAGQADEGAAFLFRGGVEGIADGGPASAHAQLESDQAGARFGASVSSAGDVDGDGYADVLVGAPDYDSGEVDEGAAFVFRGGAGGIVGNDPGTAHARLESDQAGAAFGASVAAAGDVDRDGYPDVVVGAPGFDNGQTDEGAAFVFRGGPGGVGDGGPWEAIARIQGNQAGARLGHAVASAGDVNGDGHADVFVGAPDYDNGQADEGVALVFAGNAAGIGEVDPWDAHLRLESNRAGARLGFAVASAGDLNGDGLSDVIVGAPADSTVANEAGAAFVFLGSVGTANGAPDGAHARLVSLQDAARFGESVASAGDLDGDGFTDLAVGAPGFGAGGAVFVFPGGAVGVVDADTDGARTRLDGSEAGARLGASVAAAGDTNADGFADLVIGADLHAAGQAGTGAAFVFLGNTAGRPVRAQQLRGNAAGEARPVQPWGASWDESEFRVSMEASSPRGRERAKLEIETCPAGVPFGDPGCARQVSAGWVDLGTTGASLSETLPVPAAGTLHRWRARVLHAPLGITAPGVSAPPNPRHGPWRRHTSQSAEADFLPEPRVAAGLLAGAALLGILLRRRGVPGE